MSELVWWLKKRECKECNQQLCELDFSPNQPVCKKCMQMRRKKKRINLPISGFRDFKQQMKRPGKALNSTQDDLTRHE